MNKRAQGCICGEFGGEFPLGPACQHFSTHPCASLLWMGNILLLALQGKKKKEKVVLSYWRGCTPFLTSLHPLCCRNPSPLACQLYYLLRAAVQTCSKTRTNVWSQKAQQQLCPNKIPQTDSGLGYCPFKAPLKV